MNDEKTIYAALVKAQSEFKPLKKTATNPFLKSKYSTLDDIMEATKKALAENGLGFTQSVRGNVVVTTIFHISGNVIESEFPLIINEQDPQKQGAAYTYARRYCLQAALGITAENDDDAESVVHPTQSKLSTQSKAKPTPQSVPSKESVQPTANITGIDYFKNLPDVKVEENETGEVFVSGKTYAYSSSLKKLGFVFSSESKSWIKKAA
jgi:hypothetical protein